MIKVKHGTRIEVKIFESNDLEKIGNFPLRRDQLEENSPWIHGTLLIEEISIKIIEYED